jgi:uncharacterized membrane protein
VRLTVLTASLTVLYPLAIWFGHGRIEPRWLAGLLLLTVATRLPALKLSALARWSALGAMALAAAAILGNAVLPLQLYPVLVNLSLLIAFAYSLAHPPSAVERLARLRDPQLPPAAIGYTRRVTQVWCVFFVLNGSACALLALFASAAAWSLYTGVVSYLLMGILFGVEFLVRLRFQRRQHV